MSTTTVPKNTYLFTRAQPICYLYHIHSGICALLQVDSSGREHTVMVALPGHFAGLGAFLPLQAKGITHLVDAKALTDVTAALIPVQHLQEASPDTWTCVAAILADTWISNGTLLQYNYHRQGIERLLICLYLLAARVGAYNKGYVMLPGITHDILSVITKLSRQRVSTLLSELRDSGIVRQHKGYITIPQEQMMRLQSMFMDDVPELKIIELMRALNKFNASTTQQSEGSP